MSSSSIWQRYLTIGWAIERCILRSVTSGTFGFHSSHCWRNDTSVASSSGSAKHTVTAITSSPRDSAAEMPSAVSRDRLATGTMTSDFCFDGSFGVLPIPSSAPIRS